MVRLRARRSHSLGPPPCDTLPLLPSLLPLAPTRSLPPCALTACLLKALSIAHARVEAERVRLATQRRWVRCGQSVGGTRVARMEREERGLKNQGGREDGGKEREGREGGKGGIVRWKGGKGWRGGRGTRQAAWRCWR
eukprot:3402760-Rhodomonas_salina.1